MGLRITLCVAQLAIGFSWAGHVCSLDLTECPSKYTTSTITVPSDVIWLNPKIPYCSEPMQVNPSGPPPSIVFIIDNSGSMDENDPDVARFSVVSTLLDNIHTVAPATEVGLVVFTRRLAFDHRENSYFHTAFPSDTSQHDSFVPLTALNKVFSNGVTGLDTLKALLKHDEKGNLTHVTHLPASRTNSGMTRSNTRDGTDISLGFQAAKVAMQDSKSDKSKQFFIFLSDGTPSTPDNGREGLINDFITGTATPSTYTVFFDTQHNPPVAPSTIVQMTTNIKSNGFLPGSTKSGYWAINLPGTQLEDILSVQIIGNVIFLPTAPKQATLALGEQTFNNTGIEGKAFVFPKPLPLSPTTTQVLLNYTYLYTDSSSGSPVPKEKMVPYLINILRSPGATLSGDVGQSCREQGEITLYHSGQAVSLVKADDETLEARLTLPSGQSCTNCKIQVQPSSVSEKDREDLTLSPAGGYLTGSFQREIDLVPSPGDGKLQHLPLDSIVITWRNPENPLDIIRKAFPYADVATSLQVTRHNDFSRTQETRQVDYSEWILLGPPNLQVQSNPGNYWHLNPGTLTKEDSLAHVGVALEASRAFKVDIHIFSNLGEYVNQFSFTVSPAEFEKLPKLGKGANRSIRVLWDNRAWDGRLVGTGAYVFKTTITLLKIPGIAEDNAVRNDSRVVGVLRSQ